MGLLSVLGGGYALPTGGPESSGCEGRGGNERLLKKSGTSLLDWADEAAGCSTDDSENNDAALSGVPRPGREDMHATLEDL